MYDSRNWNTAKRQAAISERMAHGNPWHSPPHFDGHEAFRIVTAACVDHQPLLNSPDRLLWFETELLKQVRDQSIPCAAWVVLPNHYHLLLKIERMKAFSRSLGQLHGRTSFEMNRCDKQRGRACWYRCSDRCMRSDDHYFATLNYIHNNPVKHGYVRKWSEWAYSSFHWYMEHRGRSWLVDLWRQYPVMSYGDKWDA